MIKQLTLAIAIVLSTSTLAQVGINTTTVDPSAALEIKATDKGVIFPRVELVTRDNLTTPVNNPAAGLMVYNTVASGTNPGTSVSPGFYYFNGTLWQRLFDNGFSMEFKQTAEVQGVVSSAAQDVPGLDTGDFNVPFRGTYQIKVTCYYTAGDPILNSDAACQGDFRLYAVEDDGSNTFIEMAYIISESKSFPGTAGEFNNLGNQFTLIRNVELEADTRYRYKIAGSQWICHNTNVSFFGKDTQSFTGSNGQQDAQYGEMTITLMEQ